MGSRACNDKHRLLLILDFSSASWAWHWVALILV